MFNNFFGFGISGNSTTSGNNSGTVPDASVLAAWNEYAAQSSSPNYDLESQQKENSSLLGSVATKTLSNETFKNSFNIISSKFTSVTESAQNAVNS